MKPFDHGYLAIGVFIGGIVSTALFLWLEWFGFSLSVGSQYFPAILGALVGGGIAIIGQLMTINHSVSESEKLRTITEEASLITIFVKLNTVLETCLKAQRHQQSNDKRSYIFLNDKPEIRKPLSGIRDKVLFSESDKTVPLLIKDADLFNLIIDAEGISESLNFLQCEYEKAFLQIERSLMSQGPAVEGRMMSGEFELKKTDLLKLKDLNDHLGRLLDESLPTIKNAHKHAIRVLSERHKRSISYEELEDVPGGVFSY